MHSRHSLLSLLAFIALRVMSAAADVPAFTAEQLDFFEKKIRPVLVEHCFKCHSAQEKIKGGFAMDTRAELLRGGDSGPAIVAGEPDQSLLVRAIRYTDEDLQMPPKHRLTPEQVKDFEQWVQMGVPDPRHGAAAARATIDWDAGRKFWSFQPVQNPPVPAVKDGAWPRNEIDRFILAKLEEKELAPNPDAEPRALIRRLTYDLTGLPPTPEEVDVFVRDYHSQNSNHHSPSGAVAAAVDRLLASPAYGERWGRHWLDVVRYADTAGCNSDFPVPSAYRYRDYVIDSFNRDKPYDQFLREQIAGDLLPARTEQERFEKIIATGYLATARRFGSQANEFHLTLEDLIDNLGKATMGLSLGCARCHDHKFDPVSARDYYALYGIFSSTTFAFPGTELARHTRDFTPLVSDRAEAERLLAESRELSALDDRVKSLKGKRKAALREEKKLAELAKDSPPLPSPNPEANKPLKWPSPTSDELREELEKAQERQEMLGRNADAYPKAYAVFDGTPRNARIQRKGEPKNLGDEVPRGFLTVLGGQAIPPDEKGSGRRQLAEWLADRANPLTARVMVNRIWQQHFARGLVKSPNDFGIRGERPTHPELLDWLASKFMEDGWSMKKLHRTILLSRAYQLSSADNPACSAKDVANDFLWRFNRRRLSAEEVRDSVLAVSGGLESGSSGQHPFSKEASWFYTQHKPFIANFETRKRSVYLMQQRIRKQPFLELFDGADTNATTAVRPVSHTPVQALWMMNNELAHAEALRFADRIYGAHPDEAGRINFAYELVLSRPAEPQELEAVRQYIGQIADALKETNLPPDQQPRAALASFTRVLLSSNEFLFVE